MIRFIGAADQMDGASATHHPCGLFYKNSVFIDHRKKEEQSVNHIRYFACFMMTWGTSAPSVILDV